MSFSTFTPCVSLPCPAQHVCMYVCVCVYMLCYNVITYMHAYALSRACMTQHKYMSLIHTRAHVCACARASICMCVYMCVCVCARARVLPYLLWISFSFLNWLPQILNLQQMHAAMVFISRFYTGILHSRTGSWSVAHVRCTYSHLLFLHSLPPFQYWFMICCTRALQLFSSLVSILIASIPGLFHDQHHIYVATNISFFFFLICLSLLMDCFTICNMRIAAPAASCHISVRVTFAYGTSGFFFANRKRPQLKKNHLLEHTLVYIWKTAKAAITHVGCMMLSLTARQPCVLKQSFLLQPSLSLQFSSQHFSIPNNQKKCTHTYSAICWKGCSHAKFSWRKHVQRLTMSPPDIVYTLLSLSMASWCPRYTLHNIARTKNRSVQVGMSHALSCPCGWGTASWERPSQRSSRLRRKVTWSESLRTWREQCGVQRILEAMAREIPAKCVITFAWW